ncbi:hypothetical protein PRIPAC_86275 [Pristionchus pacificus]|uniref:Uncharacterized protein n=1 Tax=Pristionchus pacificus TaxID=54126 RepID=A0A2A6BKW9_PRIPA|nr:hypothetical protein PRIPAC_86275 [Pristionchus pacificus]|eukprot:PDM66463.1 hypothetical protein PRIPAC_47880 [Pristionchus pacificus]
MDTGDTLVSLISNDLSQSSEYGSPSLHFAHSLASLTDERVCEMKRRRPVFRTLVQRTIKMKGDEEILIVRKHKDFREKYREITRMDSSRTWPDKDDKFPVIYHYVPSKELVLEVASFSLDAPVNNNSRIFGTLALMRREDLCQFFPFRLPTLEFSVIDGTEFNVTVNTEDAFRDFFIDRLNRDGFLVDPDYKPKVILQHPVPDELYPYKITSFSRLSPSHIQYKPQISLTICDVNNFVRSNCTTWRDEEEKECKFSHDWWRDTNENWFY